MSSAAPAATATGSPIILHQFRPAWDLQAYLRFNSISYHVENVAYPEYESTGELPQLQHGKVLVGWRKALKYLKTLKDDKDVHLTEEQRADAVAYTALLQGPLREALLYFQWVNQKRYETVTRKLAQSAMPAPLRWFVPDALHRRYAAYLDTAGWTDELAIRREASTIYTALDTKLGDQAFLFGQQPTSVDALLYGHIASAQFEPVLAELLAKHPRLLQYYTRTQAAYFPDDLAVSGVGYLATQGTNVFEQWEKEAAEAKRKQATSGKSGKAAVQDNASTERFWRWTVLSVGAVLLGTTAIVSARAK